MILTEKQQMVLTQNQHQEHQKVHEEDDSDRQRFEIIKTKDDFLTSISACFCAYSITQCDHKCKSHLGIHFEYTSNAKILYLRAIQVITGEKEISGF